MVLLRRSRLEGLNEDFSGLFALLLALRGRQGPGGSAHGPHHDGSIPPPHTCLAITTLLPALSKGNGRLGYFFYFFYQYFLQRWSLSGRLHPTAAGVEIFQVVLCYFRTRMREIGASLRTASLRDMCSSQYRHAFGRGRFPPQAQAVAGTHGGSLRAAFPLHAPCRSSIPPFPAAQSTF